MPGLAGHGRGAGWCRGAGRAHGQWARPAHSPAVECHLPAGPGGREELAHCLVYSRRCRVVLSGSGHHSVPLGFSGSAVSLKVAGSTTLSPCHSPELGCVVPRCFWATRKARVGEQPWIEGHAEIIKSQWSDLSIKAAACVITPSGTCPNGSFIK